jgi:hypothetical protein
MPGGQSEDGRGRFAIGCETIFPSTVPLKVKTSNRLREQKRPISTIQAGSPEFLSTVTFSVLAVALVAVAGLIYSPALSFQFILDDHRFVNDPRLQSSGHVGEYFWNYVWAQIPGGPSSFYRPLFICGLG